MVITNYSRLDLFMRFLNGLHIMPSRMYVFMISLYSASMLSVP